MDIRAKLETQGAKLSIESLTIEDEDGNAIHDTLPVDKPFQVATTVHLEGMPEGKGLPLVKVNLYVDGIPVGSKHIPYLSSGHSRTITMNYNPLDHAEVKPPLVSLSVRVFSELAGFSRDGEDDLSAFVERNFVDKDSDGGNDDGNDGSKKGGSGCDAGMGAGVIILASLAAALLLARKKRG
jgi:hypothetical protein